MCPTFYNYDRNYGISITDTEKIGNAWNLNWQWNKNDFEFSKEGGKIYRVKRNPKLPKFLHEDNFDYVESTGYLPGISRLKINQYNTITLFDAKKTGYANGLYLSKGGAPHI
jgi:hypothetical protein